MGCLTSTCTCLKQSFMSNPAAVTWWWCWAIVHRPPAPVVAGQPGVCIWDEGSTVSGVDHYEWWGPQVPHTQHGQPWLSGGEGHLLCSGDHLWAGRPAQRGHCLQVGPVDLIVRGCVQCLLWWMWCAIVMGQLYRAGSLRSLELVFLQWH